jgi:peptide/nickel transport system substrate-binding protein
MQGREVGRRRWPRAVAALYLTALVVASCGGGRGHETLRIVLDSSPIRTLDPHHHNTVPAWSVLSNVYDGLVRFSRDMELEPALAVSWTRLDPTHVHFELRRGVKFHDGSALEPIDVVASYERARNDARSGIRHQFVGIRGVVVDGPNAVVVETAEPSATLLNRLAFLFIVPASQARLEEITAPVGTGPYRFLSRDADGTIHLQAVHGWHGDPAIQSVEFSFVPDDQRRMAAFYAGTSDIVHRVPDADLADVAQHAGLRLVAEPRMAVQLLRIMPMAATGHARRALSDPRVRRAMLLAIDRNALVDSVFGGNATVASQYVHPVVFGYDPTVRALPYDPAQARALMKAAGFAHGFSTTLGLGTGAADVATAIRSGLATIGVKVALRELPLAGLIEQAHEGHMPLVFYARTCTTGDASELFDSVLHTPDLDRGYGAENWGGYSNAAVDRLLEAADRELDRATRVALLQHAQRLVLDDLPILPLTVRWGFVGVDDRVDIEVRHDEWLWVAAFHWRS